MRVWLGRGWPSGPGPGFGVSSASTRSPRFVAGGILSTRLNGPAVHPLTRSPVFRRDIET